MTSSLPSALLVVALLLPGHRSLAQEGLPSDQAIAKMHWERGKTFYAENKFLEASVEFERAYDLARRPQLLFNIGRCHEVLLRHKEAIGFFERYLKELPDATNRAEVRSRIAAMEAKLRGPAEDRPAPAPAITPPPPSAPAGAPRRTWRSPAGWVGVGVGGMALVAALAFGLLAKDKANQYEEAKAELTYQQLGDLDEQGELYDSLATATLVGGLAVGLVGAGLVLWDRMRAPREAPRRAFVLPYTTGQGIGLAGAVRF